MFQTQEYMSNVQKKIKTIKISLDKSIQNVWAKI